MSDFGDYPFTSHQDQGKRMDFMKFFFTSADKILETTSCQVFSRVKWIQWEWFSFKDSWWFSS